MMKAIRIGTCMYFFLGGEEIVSLRSWSASGLIGSALPARSRYGSSNVHAAFLKSSTWSRSERACATMWMEPVHGRCVIAGRCGEKSDSCCV